MKRTWGRALAALLCLVLMLCLFPALTTADVSGTCGNNLNWSFDESTGTLTITGSGEMYDYNTNNQPWASVKRQIISISLPTGISRIGQCAFYQCSILNSITIPDSVISIGMYAFHYTGYWNSQPDGCVYLDSVLLGHKGAFNQQVLSVKPGTRIIAGGAFSDCSAIISIQFPDGLVCIDDSAFSGCNGITSLAIPDSVHAIKSSAFSSCYALTSVTMPCDIILAGTAFYNSTSITDFHFTKGSGVMTNYSIATNSSEPSPFSTPWYMNRNNSLTITMEEGITSIGDYAFYNCIGLTSISIPDSIRSIGNDSFAGCTGLQTVSIPDGVTTVGGAAFGSCSNLLSISIPESVIDIERNAFIYTGWWNAQADGLICIDDILFGYKSTTPGIRSISIPDGIRLIANSAFNAFSDLSSIHIPRDVKIIGRKAFAFTELKNVYYHGTKEQRTNIEIYGDNDPLLNATWHYLPTITTQPFNVAAALGTTATFRVVATDAESYQWEYMRPGETSWNQVLDNGQAATFNQTSVAQRHNGFKFRCKVSNGSGSVLSNAATLTVGSAAVPTITSQPANVTASLGSTATFRVVATNATAYQWEYMRPGETSWNQVLDNGQAATFHQTSVAQRHNGFKFRCKVSNAGGSAYSDAATLTVLVLPTITTQPSDVTAGLGSTATFRVAATNATAYQWEYMRPGETSWNQVLDNGQAATFHQTNVAQRHNGFKFRCKVSNGSGSVLSNAAKLTVPTTAPTISSHPASVTKDLGATATFKVTASNATSYQWQYQKPGNSTWYDVQVDGKSATFNQTNVAARHNGFVFRCKVSNGIGSVYSNTAKLTVPTTAPTVSSHPSAVTKELGATATFKVTAANATSYQWQYQIPGSSTWNDVKVDGKSATFNQTNVEKRHNGYLFRCKVSNGVGSVFSNSAKLTVITTPPTITGHPSPVMTGLGTTANFKVTATNATSFQWQYKRPGESTWNDVQANGKSAVFSQTNCEKRHDGFVFRCKVTNALGSVYSNEAKLTVN